MSIDSFSRKYFYCFLFLIFIAIACHQNSHEAPSLSPSRRIKKNVVKVDTANIKFNTLSVQDSSAHKRVAADSAFHDSTSNHLQETTRKLDIKYFKKSFNLHRKPYIAVEEAKDFINEKLVS